MAYDTNRAIGEDILLHLRDAAVDNVQVGTSTGQQLNELRTLTRDAMFTEVETAEAYRESIDLMRIGRSEIEANPDGIALAGALMESLNLIGMVTRESIADPASSSYQMGLDMIDEGAMTSMGFVWINTMGNGRTAQIEAGRAYTRIALQATADDLAMQPMSQALQEYSAMAPYYESVHDLLTSQPEERVQMLARLGFAEDIGPSPRWPLATRIKKR